MCSISKYSGAVSSLMLSHSIWSVPMSSVASCRRDLVIDLISPTMRLPLRSTTTSTLGAAAARGAAEAAASSSAASGRRRPISAAEHEAEQDRDLRVADVHAAIEAEARQLGRRDRRVDRAELAAPGPRRPEREAVVHEAERQASAPVVEVPIRDRHVLAGVAYGGREIGVEGAVDRDVLAQALLEAHAGVQHAAQLLAEARGARRARVHRQHLEAVDGPVPLGARVDA